MEGMIGTGTLCVGLTAGIEGSVEAKYGAKSKMDQMEGSGAETALGAERKRRGKWVRWDALLVNVDRVDAL
jgi:hypothetical protein